MVFHAFSIRMNKNRFEEDDGIDMNDIERFLPHLRSVSPMFFFFPFLVKWNLVFVDYPASFGPRSIYCLFNTAPCWHNGWITATFKKTWRVKKGTKMSIALNAFFIEKKSCIKVTLNASCIQFKSLKWEILAVTLDACSVTPSGQKLDWHHRFTIRRVRPFSLFLCWKILFFL